MKLLALIFTVQLIFSVQAKISVKDDLGKENYLVLGLLERTMECIRNIVANGDVGGDLGSFKEFEIPLIEIDESLWDDKIKFKLNVPLLKVFGLDEFTVNKAGLNILGFEWEYDIVLHVKTSGDYTAHLEVIPIIDIEGEGDLNLQTDINLIGQFRLWPKSSGWEFTEYRGYLTVDPTFDITGISNDETLSKAISKQLSNILKDFVNGNAENISPGISQQIKDALNGWINDTTAAITVEDVFNLIERNCPAVEELMQVLRKEVIKQNLQ